jgi:hypothetical protein
MSTNLTTRIQQLAAVRKWTIPNTNSHIKSTTVTSTCQHYTFQLRSRLVLHLMMEARSRKKRYVITNTFRVTNDMLYITLKQAILPRISPKCGIISEQKYVLYFYTFS